MSSADWQIPGLDDQVPTKNRDDDDLDETLHGFEDIQLPAPPKADAYASYMALARGFRRAKESELQAAAKRIGSMMGEDGFYAWEARNADGSKNEIAGESIELMKALANKWGACGYGVELERIEDDRVFLVGVCIDFTNFVVVRRPYTFHLAPAPGRFAKSHDQRTRWETMQIQSATSKALRGAIVDCLPSWYVRPAYEEARRAARYGSEALKGINLEDAKAAVITAYQKDGIPLEDLEGLLNAPVVEWGIEDVLGLRDTFRAIKKKDTTPKEVFGAVWDAKAAKKNAGADLGLKKSAPETKKTEPAPKAETSSTSAETKKEDPEPMFSGANQPSSAATQGARAELAEKCRTIEMAIGDVTGARMEAGVETVDAVSGRWSLELLTRYAAVLERFKSEDR